MTWQVRAVGAKGAGDLLPSPSSQILTVRKLNTLLQMNFNYMLYSYLLIIRTVLISGRLYCYFSLLHFSSYRTFNRKLRLFALTPTFRPSYSSSSWNALLISNSKSKSSFQMHAMSENSEKVCLSLVNKVHINKYCYRVSR